MSDLNVVEQAAPVRISTSVPKDELDVLFDIHWNQYSQNIPPPIKQKAMKGRRALERDRVVKIAGGTVQFYFPVLNKFLMDKVREKMNREILMTVQMNLEDSEKVYFLESIGFYEPAVDLNFSVTGNTAFRMQVPEIPEDQKTNENKAAKDQEEQVFAQMIQYLQQTCSVTPIPDAWAQAKAREIYNMQASQLGGEAKMVEILGHPKEQLMAFHTQNLKKQLSLNLILRHMGRRMGIPGELKLNKTHEYADVVRKHLLNTMEVVVGPEIKVLDLFERTPDVG